MDENNETTGSQAVAATNSVEKAVQFVNAEVLAPPTAAPMGGIAKVMIEQSTGMMVQDLQSFLKGFEQVGLVALSRLANNLLTYGTPSEQKPHPKSSAPALESEEVESGAQGNEMMKDLFKIVSDYAEAKAKISNTIFNTNPHQNLEGLQNIPSEIQDTEKKNE